MQQVVATESPADVVHLWTDAMLREMAESPAIPEHRTLAAELAAFAASLDIELPDAKLSRAFQLSPLELKVIHFSLAPEFDVQLSRSADVWPTVRDAAALLAPARGNALHAAFRDDAPLVRWNLIRLLDAGLPLFDRRIAADVRIVQMYSGLDTIDPLLVDRVDLIRWNTTSPVCGQWTVRNAHAFASRVTKLLENPDRQPMVVNLHGLLPDDLIPFAAATAHACSAHLLVLREGNLSDIPIRAAWLREALLQRAIPFAPATDSEVASSILQAMGSAGPLIMLASTKPLTPPQQVRSSLWIALAAPVPPTEVRHQAWQKSLAAHGSPMQDGIEQLAADYEMSEQRIWDAARGAVAEARIAGQPLSLMHLHSRCRTLSQKGIAVLAEHIESRAGWSDLVLPSDSSVRLNELCAQVRLHAQIFERAGFGERMTRGRGVNALFSGPSGTGKTMAAEVVANELGRDLYRVDLAQVVSKYIGETEKNLAQVFSAAEKARCVLLFDEADALFGRRTEVRDSHDRYANLEVSYLLQRFEHTEHAVVLLATNRRQNIDEAFLRRFRFVIDFQVPDATLRRELWRLSFPRQTRVENVDFDRLADKLVLTGASIRNIALAASFLAAAESVAVQPEHLSHAIRRELEKLGQPAQITASAISLTRPTGGRG